MFSIQNISSKNMRVSVRFKIRGRIVCLMLVIVIFSIYWQALHCDFIEIDDYQFLVSPYISKGLSIEAGKEVMC